MKISLSQFISALALLGSLNVTALDINIASVPTSTLQFNGSSDSFDFAPAYAGPAVGWDFAVTSVTGGFGDSVGLLGHIDGPFTIGAVTVNGPLQTAPVTGSGTLHIASPSGDLSAAVVWDTISTLGAGGLLNVNATLNLSSISYAGSTQDLLNLTAPGSGIATVSFQFAAQTDLTELTANGASTQVSWSGSLSNPTVAPPVPDVPSTAGLLGAALTGLVFIRRFANR